MLTIRHDQVVKSENIINKRVGIIMGTLGR
jgi:hypothetical protein